MSEQIASYAVKVFNDDHTPMWFVVKTLMNSFRFSIFEATDWMMAIHLADERTIGCFTKDIAQTKVSHLIEMADRAGYPLYAEISMICRHDG